MSLRAAWYAEQCLQVTELSSLAMSEEVSLLPIPQVHSDFKDQVKGQGVHFTLLPDWRYLLIYYWRKGKID